MGWEVVTPATSKRLRTGDTIRVRKHGGKRAVRAWVASPAHVVGRWTLIGYRVVFRDGPYWVAHAAYHVATLGGSAGDTVERET